MPTHATTHQVVQQQALDTPHTAITTHTKEIGAKAVYPDQEVYDPYDDWCLRDILLGLTPLFISYAFRGIDLFAALAVGIVFAGIVLLMRCTLWDSRTKFRWLPTLELITLILFAIMMGLIKHKDLDARDEPWWERWWTIIAPAVFAAATLATLIIRQPWTAHYARYPKYATSGRDLWTHSADWRQHSDSATGLWLCAFSVMCLLSLIPVMTGHWDGYHGLNVVFNYIVPALLGLLALIGTWMIGRHYKRFNYAATAFSEGAGYRTAVTDIHPAGVATTGAYGTTAAYPAVQAGGATHAV